MAISYKTCPKCGHTAESATERCTACGIIHAKWLQQQLRSADPAPIEPSKINRSAWIKERFLHVDQDMSPGLVYGHAFTYLLFFIWGWSFIWMEIESNEIGQSFLHNVNLVFHEAGHVIFRLFGEFMSTLGGSLMQLIVPFTVAIVFVVKQRNNFGASIGLWWLGQSMMDLAPYINDARSLELMLLGGGTGADRPGWHDWENILLELNLLEQDHAIATAVDTCGEALMISAMVWGGATLLQEFRNLAKR